MTSTFRLRNTEDTPKDNQGVFGFLAWLLRDETALTGFRRRLRRGPSGRGEERGTPGGVWVQSRNPAGPPAESCQGPDGTLDMRFRAHGPGTGGSSRLESAGPHRPDPMLGSGWTERHREPCCRESVLGPPRHVFTDDALKAERVEASPGRMGKRCRVFGSWRGTRVT